MECTAVFSIAGQVFFSLSQAAVSLQQREPILSVWENPFSTIKSWQFIDNPPYEFCQINCVLPQMIPTIPGWGFGCTFAALPSLAQGGAHSAPEHSPGLAIARTCGSF